MSTVRIQIRRGTATGWQDVNPILGDGEMGYETTSNQFKFGNGSTHWNDLPYAGLNQTNLDELAQDAIASALSAGSGINISYDDNANTISVSNSGVLSFNTRTGAVTLSANDVNTALGYTAANQADVDAITSELNTDHITEGTTNKYYSSSLVRDTIDRKSVV